MCGFFLPMLVSFPLLFACLFIQTLRHSQYMVSYSPPSLLSSSSSSSSSFSFLPPSLFNVFCCC
jgi:hypothetical protein